jgi:hypothetical protein
MMRAVLMLAGLGLLSACGGGTSAPAPAVNEATTNEAALNYQAAVLDLSPGQRNVVMIRAIQDAGITCNHVTESAPAKGEGLTFRAKCDDGASHVVSIAADGNAKVISAGSAPKR